MLARLPGTRHHIASPGQHIGLMLDAFPAEGTYPYLSTRWRLVKSNKP